MSVKKRNLIVLLGLMLSFSACSMEEDPAVVLEKSRTLLAGEPQFSLHFTAAAVEAEATLTWGAGEQTLHFEAPDSVAGLSVSRSESGLSLSLDGVSAKVSAGALVDSSAAQQLFDALDGISAADTESGELSVEDGLLQLDFDDLSLWLDAETGEPLALEGEEFSCQLSVISDQ